MQYSLYITGMKNLQLQFSTFNELNAYLVSANNGLDIANTALEMANVISNGHTVKSLLKQVNSGIINLIKNRSDIAINTHTVLNLVYFPAMYTLGSDELIDNYIQNPNYAMGNKIYNFDYKPFYNV